MTRPRWLLLALLVLLLAGAVLLRTSAGRVGSDALPDAPSAASGPAARAAHSNAAAAGVDTIRNAARRAVEPAVPLAIGEASLRVVRAEDREPLPGAEVWFRDDASLLMRHVGDESGWDLDPFAHVLRFGQRRVADVAGRVVIGADAGEVPVAGVFEDRVGFAWLKPPAPEEGYVLALGPRTPLAVEVVDVEDRPVPGMPIRLFASSNSWSARYCTPGVTDAEGRLVIAHPAPWFGENVTTAMVGVEAPGLGSAAVSFDPHAIPSAPLRLTLPATGRIEVVVATEAGVPLRNLAVRVNPSTSARDEPVTDLVVTSDDSGQAVFPFTALGRRMSLRGDTRPDAIFVQFDGPTRAGEVVHVVARPEKERAVLQLQLVDERGSALAKVPFDLELESSTDGGRARTASAVLRTDCEGRAFVVLDQRLARGVILRGRFRAAAPLRQADPRSASFVRRGPLAVGLHDLGVLVLRQAEPVMSGTLVASDGRVVVRATAMFPGANHDRPAPQFQLDGEGRFTVFALGPALPAAMRLTAPQCFPLEVPLQAGTHDLRVVLPRACSIQLTVLLDGGRAALCNSLRCELLASDGTSREERVWQTADGGGRALFAPLSEGNHGVRLWLSGFPEPLHAADVATGPGTGWEHQITVDLRGRLRPMRVRAESAGTGMPLAGATVCVGRPRSWQGRFAREGVYCDPEGIAQLAVREDQIELLVEAQGHAPLPWSGVPQDMTLSLEPLPELELRLSGVDLPPAGARVEVELRAEVGSAWISGERRAEPFRSYAVVNSGRGRTRAPALGPVTATLSIAIPGTPVTTRPLRAEPAVITTSTQTLVLRP